MTQAPPPPQPPDYPGPYPGPYQPGYGPAPMAYQKTNTMATLSLVMGIMSFVGLGCFGGILAILFGNMAEDQIRLSQGMETGEGMAKAGKILGWINLILSIGGVLIALIVFVILAILGITVPLVSGQ